MSKAWCIAGWMKNGGLLAVLIIVLTGCSLFTYEGSMVRDAYLIGLADGAHRSDRYQARDLTIAYEWERSGDELQLSGTVEYTQRMRQNFNMIPSFRLSVFFTDAIGRILEERWIPTPGSEDPNKQMHFSEKLILPRGTANMAFSYSGQGHDTGGAGKGSGGKANPFWHIPIVR